VLVQQLLDDAEHLEVARGQHDQVVADPFQVGEQVEESITVTPCSATLP
jgi:hypothetical protein